MTNKRLYELAIAGLNAELEKVERKIATAKHRIDNGESQFREVLTKLQDEREGLAEELYHLKTEVFVIDCGDDLNALIEE